MDSPFYVVTLSKIMELKPSFMNYGMRNVILVESRMVNFSSSVYGSPLVVPMPSGLDMLTAVNPFSSLIMPPASASIAVNPLPPLSIPSAAVVPVEASAECGAASVLQPVAGPAPKVRRKRIRKVPVESDLLDLSERTSSSVRPVAFGSNWAVEGKFVFVACCIHF